MNLEKIVFVDLETTGANATIDRITEIGIVEVTADGKVTHWSTLVNPGISIPAFIQGLTGISNEMVHEAPSFKSLAKDLYERLQGALFIAHNVRFDYGFLRNEFTEAGYTFKAEVLCTVKLSRKLYPDQSRHNLDALVSRHNLKVSARHRALGDADLLWQLWQKIHTEFEPETIHAALHTLLQKPSLPSHLPSDVLDDCPDTPGVYLFYGENNSPLYVGKSVHLRQRVMSHFSSDHKLYKDMRLSQQLHRIEWRVTVGEIGALLLEAKLIKQLQPIHNKTLRRQDDLCTWRLLEDGTGRTYPELCYASENSFGRADRLYGLFSSKRKAEAVMRDLAESHQLCLVHLGLEANSKTNPACFGWQLRRCKGVCVGKEHPSFHRARLEAALSQLHIKTWPYTNAVALIETVGDKTDMHLVNNWCYMGTPQSEDALSSLLEEAPTKPSFDKDTYKILSKALLKGQLQVKQLRNATKII